MRKLVIVGAALLSGCTGAKYAMDNYNDTPAKPYQHRVSGTWYRIHDKPRENRLMITASLGGAAGQGMVKGLTLGIVGNETPGVVYRDVSLEYLAVSGRSCDTKEVTLIIEPQYEVRYECFADRPVPPVPPPYKAPPPPSPVAGGRVN